MNPKTFFFSESSKDSQYSDETMDVDGLPNFDRSEKYNMTDKEAKYLASKNMYNNAENSDILYNDYTGYIRTCNGDLINSALSKMSKSNITDKEKEQAKETLNRSNKTIELLDKATKINVFTKDTDLYSMVGFNFLKNNFGIDINIDIYDENSSIIKAYNELLKISPCNLNFTEFAFTSCSYKEFGSEHFQSSPIELIIHCEPGQTYFQTNNFQESEIILPRKTIFGIERFSLYDTDYGEKLVIELCIQSS